jgi:F-type H+-transporting ATPase subunit alpha
MVDERTRKTIAHGRCIRAVLGQPQFAPLSLGLEVGLLYALNEGLLDSLTVTQISRFRSDLTSWLAEHCPEILALDDRSQPLTEDLRARLKASLVELSQTVRERSQAPPGVQS